MDPLTLMLGASIVAFLFFFFSFNLPEEHGLLRLFLIIFALLFLIFVPKTAIDTRDHCEIVTRNDTLTTANTTTYEYDRVCFPNTNTTDTTFFRLYLGFLGVFVLYIFVFWSKELLEWLSSIVRGIRR